MQRRSPRRRRRDARRGGARALTMLPRRSVARPPHRAVVARSRVRASTREATRQCRRAASSPTPSMRRRNAASSDSRAAAPPPARSSLSACAARGGAGGLAGGGADLLDERLDALELGAVDRGGPRLLRGLKLRGGTSDLVEPLAQLGQGGRRLRARRRAAVSGETSRSSRRVADSSRGTRASICSQIVEPCAEG